MKMLFVSMSLMHTVSLSVMLIYGDLLEGVAIVNKDITK